MYVVEITGFASQNLPYALDKLIFSLCNASETHALEEAEAMAELLLPLYTPSSAPCEQPQNNFIGVLQGTGRNKSRGKLLTRNFKLRVESPGYVTS
ncbi:hypothetical protein MTHERMOG20_00080 [Moorella thermoacetica]|uniref:Uncharacterized protein n=1 Tax=Neomoorella thermoacetica TaxID=1525 RepID=A0AAC9HIG5_NEOTH|nr:hypothetical protein Maut_01904 [Moorella thermoacetica]OIQ54513.1 hypothetical protein MORE_14820 [Moorella thermoacetica]TYL14748.1 hypothetical protein MTAT_09830 [Moorella thermoacetica]GLI15554.1 hypothetical protein MTHERMOG20_00080 [Moorella thermoacetica]